MQWFAVGLGTLGTALSLVMVVPQGVIIWRARSLDGVSVTAWAVLVLTLSIWSGFASRTGNPTMVVGNAVALAVCSWIVLAIVRAKRFRPAWLWGALLGFVVGVPAAILFGYTVRGLVIQVILTGTALTWLPQAFRSVRTLVHGSASDVSRASLVMGIVANAAWTVYGVIRPEVMIGIASFVQVAVISSVLVLEFAAGRRRQRRAGRELRAQPVHLGGRV